MKILYVRHIKGSIEKIGVNWGAKQFIHLRKPKHTNASDHGCSSNFLNEEMLIGLLNEPGWQIWDSRKNGGLEK